ncbi:translational GTPase TypA [Candidatus Roizmanbacteria bacterium CG_4_9_14_0_2_um_filter_39_13]|uniref:50S ribosomal subunit assembly factor BipA n=2 Tax=Candidatus Roizmaniibacteriota TaxID=1752723 RepID=A0A2M8F352_9BACT|nr:MAG: translational GTPase TypA [Candidatus Roizmanbacteria bacterium CG_4_10_14_0_2_um_filter_39_12]PJC33715.1 MAG: translational GTPase TypA [Candidatus Roizmanbacteria bacterium CG_4_9_14_0_2_um_filter_39_13]PJE62053.1 MAG: translational GTPase TypA [Candidatus Roizmanbacteria bacterium CG10_big_fil_rev_8_21_14_0_10_39_12]
MKIKNIAIIAHVDHGKTTLVDGLLKQSHIFRDNQKEMSQVLLMDSNDLEKEKGITILAKNTSIEYLGEKINIIDTPGHADFGSEVERVLNMASGALLLVDAAEGPLPQTRFVLKKALEAGLKLILFINKIDKKDARPIEVKHEVENLFLELAEHEDMLNFVTLYGVGRDGKAYAELPENYTSDLPGDLTPLLDVITSELENSNIDEDKPFQMLISTIDHDPYVGRLCIGKITRGTLKKGQRISLVDNEKVIGTFNATKLFTSRGLQKVEVDEIVSGDIASLAGIPELSIGQTVTDPATPESLPVIHVEEPTIRIKIGPNTSPFAGREGQYVTSRQIHARLYKELETDLGLRVEDDPDSNACMVSGRGELHLAMLIESMRREGFELEVSKPQVIFKKVDNVQCEPYEELTIDIPKDYMGVVTEEIGKRKGKLINMTTQQTVNLRLVYKISSRNLIGIRSNLMTNTRGTAVMNTYLIGYEPLGSTMETIRNGVLIATQGGEALSYGLANAQIRGTMFYGPGTNVYEGMAVGLASQEKDLEVNVCKGKNLTNNRSSGEGVKIQLEPPTILSLEQYLDFVGDDEYLEVTPESLRLRKMQLTLALRRVNKRNG